MKIVLAELFHVIIMKVYQSFYASNLGEFIREADTFRKVNTSTD